MIKHLGLWSQSSWLESSVAMVKFCDLGQVTLPISSSVPSSVNGGIKDTCLKMFL